MNTRIRIALASVLVLVACRDGALPSSPSSPDLTRLGASASIVTDDLPSIQFPSGIANDGTILYVSTLIGFRDTYRIDPTMATILGTVPGGFNPRDVVWMFPGQLALSDVDFFVSVRNSFTGAVVDSVPIPWRGGGIARWMDSLYVGNQDADSILVFYYNTSLATPHPIIRKFATPMRPEGLVIDSAPGTIATLWSITPFDSFIYQIDLLGNLLRKCNTPYIPGPYGLGGVTLLRDTFFIAHPVGGDPFAGTTILRVAKTELVCGSGVDPDSIDIKPGQFPNRVNPRSHAKIDVAVLTTPSRDATTLIPATVRFGRTGTEALPQATSLEDVDGDGDIDAVFTFRTSDTGIICGDTAARLKAMATTGPPIDASDSILIVGGCRP